MNEHKTKALAKQKKESPAYHQDVIREHWGNGKPMKHEGKNYSVHRMSYGDYFMEPYSKKNLSRGEKEPFASGTKWLKKHPEKKDHYVSED